MKNLFARLEDLWVTAAFAESGEYRVIPKPEDNVLSECPVPENAY